MRVVTPPYPLHDLYKESYVLGGNIFLCLQHSSCESYLKPRIYFYVHDTHVMSVIDTRGNTLDDTTDSLIIYSMKIH